MIASCQGNLQQDASPCYCSANTVLCFILTISLYAKLWFMMKRLASLHNVHTLDKPQSEDVCDIPDIFQPL